MWICEFIYLFDMYIDGVGIIGQHRLLFSGVTYKGPVNIFFLGGGGGGPGPSKFLS